ncbi:ArsR/SmtB family transcription factor [Streptomyces palmae]|uniref:Transcriptional regulator n=1 Tax=Streptomyces palmae TaxID=1701085 RepID=A0A4Z0GGJ1_9ACTN|nr:metalloregulator ArsR/SmtB family transcription factor [Streptomyces palmae]TGA95243.1 transcriptional regulator [Streptomyces palmae]
MISFELGVEDLADTRFALSPVQETLLSLRILQDPGLSAIHLPWRRSVLDRIGGLDTRLLMSLVSPRRTIPDFLTPMPAVFAPAFEEQLADVRRASPARIRRDVSAAYGAGPLPAALDRVLGEDASVVGLREDICELLRRYWEVAIEPSWRQLRLLMEADMTYRARQLAVGGARLLFADIHPDLRWRDGVLHIDKMISHFRVASVGRGLLLLPSAFAHKPAGPVGPDEPPHVFYPCRGTGTLWAAPPAVEATALAALLGAPRARLLALLQEPLATVEIARRLRVTPSAVSQHLRVLHAAGLVTRAREGRRVLYRCSGLGERLAAGAAGG